MESRALSSFVIAADRLQYCIGIVLVFETRKASDRFQFLCSSHFKVSKSNIT